MEKLAQLSKFISLILRHKPETINITVDEHGWADVDELIAGINHTGKKISLPILKEIVANDSKQRYSFNQDDTLIRANQGHSISVDVELTEQEPPKFLYHGTASRFIGSIEKEGLKPMSRLYVHLSKDIDTAIKVGERHGIPVVLKIYSGDMYQDGHKFYISENGVWLVKKIGTKYFERY